MTTCLCKSPASPLLKRVLTKHQLKALYGFSYFKPIHNFTSWYCWEVKLKRKMNSDSVPRWHAFKRQDKPSEWVLLVYQHTKEVGVYLIRGWVHRTHGTNRIKRLKVSFDISHQGKTFLSRKSVNIWNKLPRDMQAALELHYIRLSSARSSREHSRGWVNVYCLLQLQLPWVIEDVYRGIIGSNISH